MNPFGKAYIDVTKNAGGSGNSASFLGYDTATQGNWVGVYGTDGFVFARAASGPEAEGFSAFRSLPGYASFGTSSGSNFFQWIDPATDIRASEYPDMSDRFASTWYSEATEVFDLTISGTAAVTIYFLDWDSGSRSVTVTVKDGTTVLDGPRTISAMSPVTNAYFDGIYLSWSVSGHVQFKITPATHNATISAFFFD